MKVAVIFHRFGPYHCARLGAAAQQCAVVGIELGAETREYGWSKVERSEAFQWVTLFPEGDSRQSPVSELQKRVCDALSAAKPDVVAVPGWSDKGALAALRWSLDNRVPAVLMSETAALDESRVWWKEFVKRRIVALYSAALIGGHRHADYLADLGMPKNRVFMGYDAVDNEFFAQGAKEVRGQRTEDGDQTMEVRGQTAGLPENYFLASARFIPKKNLDTLIRVYAEYRKRSEVRGQKSEGSEHRLPTSDLRPRTTDPWSLVLLGDGPLNSDLRQLISDLGLQDFVVLPGFKQYDELPLYYGLANAFVHASRVEQWGLVVNEAMASGLPVIVSDRCGCASELVQEGINGFTFDPGDEAQLTSRLLEMASLCQRRREEFGQASRRIVGDFGPERFADGLMRAAETAVKSGAMKPALLQGMLLHVQLHR